MRIRTIRSSAVLKSILAAAFLLLLAVSFSGCKKEEGSVLPEREEMTETEETTKDEAAPSKETADKEPAEEKADAGKADSKDAAESETISEENSESEDSTGDPAPGPDFEISPRGGYFITFAGYDEDGKYLSDFSAHVDANVTEEADPDHPGYKTVIGTFKMDLSANPGAIYWNWVSAFDRESGISFECAAEKNAYSADPTLAYEGLGVLELPGADGGTKEIRMKIDTENNYPEVTDKVTVYCPEDYDGTVFQIGYISEAELNAYGSLRPAEEFVTIGQLPNIGEEMYYFTAEDK